MAPPSKPFSARRVMRALANEQSTLIALSPTRRIRISPQGLTVYGRQDEPLISFTPDEQERLRITLNLHRFRTLDA